MTTIFSPLMRSIAFSLMIALFTGCVLPSTQNDGYTRFEVLETVIAPDCTYTLSKKSRSTTRWVPIRDVERTEFDSYVLTIATENANAVRSEIDIELINQPGVTPHRPPFFLGSTARFCFWGTNYGYLAVHLDTGTIKVVRCDPKFGAFGKATPIDEQTLRRETKYGVFELTPTGAREITE